MDITSSTIAQSASYLMNANSPSITAAANLASKGKGNELPINSTKVAEGFESLFLSLLIKEMRNTLDPSEGGLFGSESSDSYGGMFDMFMGQSLAANRQLGIADAVESYLTNQFNAEELEQPIDLPNQ